MNTTMNTVNQTFNWSRFTVALRKEVVENKRAILFSLLGTYALLTMIMVIGNLSPGTATEIDNLLECYVPQKVVYAILSFATIVVASLSFRDLTSKTGRIELFTTPSSMPEKFLVNTIVYVFGYMVAFFICAQLADLTRFALLWPFRGEHLFVPGPINFFNVVPATVTGIGSVNEVARWMEPYMWISLLACPGLYLLGSVVWPRLSLLKTFAAIYAVEFVIGILAMILIYTMGDSMESVGEWMFQHLQQFMMALTLFYALLTIVVWALAWYLFKRKDVVSLKWWK